MEPSDQFRRRPGPDPHDHTDEIPTFKAQSSFFQDIIDIRVKCQLVSKLPVDIIDAFTP